MKKLRNLSHFYYRKASLICVSGLLPYTWWHDSYIDCCNYVYCRIMALFTNFHSINSKIQITLSLSSVWYSASQRILNDKKIYSCIDIVHIADQLFFLTFYHFSTCMMLLLAQLFRQLYFGRPFKLVVETRLLAEKRKIAFPCGYTWSCHHCIEASRQRAWISKS